MRLSGLVFASILLGSAVLLAQHSSSGGGGSHSGGSSGVSAASGYTSSSSASHASANPAPSASSRSHASIGSISAARSGSGRSFFHPFRRANTVPAGLFLPEPCLKGRCGLCPAGESRNGAGRCSIVSNLCAYGTGYGCSSQLWFSSCRFLATQLSAQQELMWGRDDFGEGLRYQWLQDQYHQCLQRYGLQGFGAYEFDEARVLDLP